MVNSTAKGSELPTRVTRNNWQVADVKKAEGPASAPLSVAAPLLAPEAAQAKESGKTALELNAAGDKLEGYVERLFLKEDGR